VDIDVVHDLMIHDIDLVLTLVTSEVKEIRAHGASFLIDKLDAVNARFEFANGCVANLNASRVSMKKERSITVFEKEKFFYIDLLNGRLTTCFKNKSGNIETIEFVADKMDAVNEELLDFITSMLQRKKPQIHGIDGLKALTIANQITKHIAERKFS